MAPHRFAESNGSGAAAAPRAYTFVMPKDKRQIHLDPMEWKDAMDRVKTAVADKGKKAPPKTAPAKKSGR
jgi:hypothetical protein